MTSHTYLSQISSRERGVIKRSRHSSGRSLSEEEPAQTLLEECWLDGQEILEREQHIKKIEVIVFFKLTFCVIGVVKILDFSFCFVFRYLDDEREESEQ